MKTLSHKIFTTLMMAVLVSFLMISGAGKVHAKGFTEISVGDSPWKVEYLHSVYDAAEKSTTFVYSVTVTRSPDLSHMVFELPETYELIGWDGIGPVEILTKPDPTTGVMGIKFDGGQKAGTTVSYSFTLRGNWEVGTILYSVKGATLYAIGEIMGPVGTGVTPIHTYNISGSVYIDANGNGIMDAGEPPLSNVTVGLLDASGNSLSGTITNAAGYYEFSGLVSGNYMVAVWKETNLDDFNEMLAAYFKLSGDNMVAISLGAADSRDNNFAYHVNVGDILADLNHDDPDADGFTFTGNGKTIGYWKHQLNVAIKGKGKAQVDAVTMQSYMDMIESFYLVNPFQFNDSNEYVGANEILSMTSSDGLDLLKKQLLGTEFNEVSGLGFGVQHDALQTILVKWGEYLAANSSQFGRDALISAKDIFDGINNTGNY